MELNLNYLMRKTSKRLHTIVRQFDNSNNLLSKICLRMDLEDNALYNVLTDILDVPKTSYIPICHCINNKFIYISIFTSTELFVIGPIKYQVDYGLRDSISVTINDEIETELISILSNIGWDTLIDTLVDFSNYLLGTSAKEVTELDFININCLDKNLNKKIQKDLTDFIFSQHESGLHHNPYDQELRELSAIENGNVAALEKSLAEDYIGQLGRLAKDDLRNMKNISLVVIATSSRAAIKGGLSPEIAFSMADIYSQKIEESTSKNVPLQITRNAEFEYTRMVHELRNNNTQMNSFSGEENEHIMAAKNYIFKNLHSKISVADIAEALGLNANYLSGLFTLHEKITLKKYILNNKLTLVKNMLTYSAYSYSEIAYYLGFSSQSHLGKEFKKATGLTLSQYRTKYQMQEFLD